jgi:uncharacterized protein YdiU (UPF0061 family)
MRFDNRFLRQTPGDTLELNTPRQVFGAAWSPVVAAPVTAPRLLAWSTDMARELGLERPADDASDWVQTLAGNRLLPGMQSYAMCYGGHQFGHWAGQLGDGRAIALGEMLAPDQVSWELQLKGAGPTPYSRTADGRAVLRSSLREFICSEAMHHLGVPTTRALSLVGTGEGVVRDMFYDGRPEREPGAVVCRVAPSFLRFGSYELPASRQDHVLLKQLVAFTIRNHYPEFAAEQQLDILGWFREVCARTARLMVHWMRVGFVHGVMNTDNMSIHGLTIDYGPYGWLEPFDPDWTPNTTDAQGRRYRFGNQAGVAQWNLRCLAQALAPLLEETEALSEALGHYAEVFHADYAASFATKLGLATLKPNDALLQDLLSCMGMAETDYGLLFRHLADLPTQQTADEAGLDADLAQLAPAFYSPACRSGPVREAWRAWLVDWRARLGEAGLDELTRRTRMNAVNPLFVPRNYLAQQAIDQAAQGDLSELHTLQKVLSKPYEDQPEHAAYAQRRPEWARDKPGCSALSCSS